MQGRQVSSPMPPSPTRRLARLVLVFLLGGAAARATIVGLNQIVTPDMQPAGVLALSAQVQHSAIGNSQQVQAELGLTPRLEAAWFQGLTPGEGLFSAEVNLLNAGPHLLSLALLNWSTRGTGPQAAAEYGFYHGRNKFIAGVAEVHDRAELLLGFKHDLSDRLAFSADFQSGPGNAATVGLTVNLTTDLSINPALYYTNGRRHHLLGYVVLTWNVPVWR